MSCRLARSRPVTPEAIALLGLGFIASLVGIIYWIGRERDTKQDRDLSDHIKEDVRAHERLTAVETKVANLESEVKAIREMRHEIMKHTSDALAGWYANVVDTLGKRYGELVTMIERLKR